MANNKSCPIYCARCNKLKTYGKCIPCRQEWDRNNYAKKKEKFKQRNASQYAKHRERNLAYVRNYRGSNKEKITAIKHSYYESNKDNLLKKGADIRKRYAERNISNPPPFNETTFRVCPSCTLARPTCLFYFYPSNSHGYSVYCKDCHALKQACRRVKAGSISPIEWISVVERFGRKCAYCAATGDLTIDHFQPIYLNGSNAITNLVPACKSCNCKKNKIDPYIWISRTFGSDHPMMDFGRKS